MFDWSTFDPDKSTRWSIWAILSIKDKFSKNSFSSIARLETYNRLIGQVILSPKSYWWIELSLKTINHTHLCVYHWRQWLPLKETVTQSNRSRTCCGPFLVYPIPIRDKHLEYLLDTTNQRPASWIPVRTNNSSVDVRNISHTVSDAYLKPSNQLCSNKREVLQDRSQGIPVEECTQR